MYDVAGKQSQTHSVDNIQRCLESLRAEQSEFSQLADEDYLLVASHVEEGVRAKIINHEYVDFARLLRRDRSNGLDEDAQQRMVMVNKGGLSYWVPLTDKSNSINGYARWDQAFRVRGPKATLLLTTI